MGACGGQTTTFSSICGPLRADRFSYTRCLPHLAISAYAGQSFNRIREIPGKEMESWEHELRITSHILNMQRMNVRFMYVS